jgi:hypothetical protein
MTILSIIPAIIAAIRAIEAAVPDSGQGKQKLDAVIAIIEAADESVKKLIPQFSAVIGIIVNLFNVTGVFKKSA